jgi:hypothetical protein
MTITGQMLAQSDAFRHAFTAIATEALPFMAKDAYFSDLLHDAATVTTLNIGTPYYLLVRSLGTNHFADPVEAMQHCGLRSDGRAVLRIVRGRYDSFNVTVVFTRYSGFVA